MGLAKRCHHRVTVTTVSRSWQCHGHDRVTVTIVSRSLSCHGHDRVTAKTVGNHDFPFGDRLSGSGHGRLQVHAVLFLQLLSACGYCCL